MNIEEPVSTSPRRRPWPRALAGIGVVAVIGAGLGAYLGIRVVQGAGSGGSSGQPPARTGAAMAFDAANGTVVLFGGNGRSRSLGDTWIWDGSAWTQAHPSTSPPRLSGAQMTYDPVSHDLVLVGGQRLEPVPLAGNVCSSSGSSGSGSAIGSTGSTGSGATGWIPPANPPQPADAPQPTGAHRAPMIVPDCGISTAANSATWLWNGNDWSKASGSTPSVGFGAWTLATDPVSNRALLLAPQPFVAMPYMPAAAPGIACPVRITPTNQPIAQPACPPFPIANPTWMWTGHSWKAVKTASNASMEMFGRSVIADAVSGHLAIFSSSFSLVPLPAKCPACVGGVPTPVDQATCCSGSVSVWNGSGWRQTKSWTHGPMLSGGTFVGDPTTHSDVYLTSSGQTWVWDGAWTRKHPGASPPALEGSAAVFDAATGQVVQFGGFGSTGRANGLYDQTWTWDGSNWARRAGTVGPAVRIPVPTPVGVPPTGPCERVPVTTSPAKAVPQATGSCSSTTPGALPGSTGGGISTATGATAQGTGVIAP